MRRALVLALLALGALAPVAHAAPKPPFGHAGRWITDASGRVVILHGLNMVNKFAPYRPDSLGFGEDDARFLARNGFNSVRLGIVWKGLEPRRGRFDDRYLDRIALIARMLERHGIWPVIDFHQDMWNERYQGEGAPDWALYDDGLPNRPGFGFPTNYVAMPAVSRAFESFWTNRAGVQGEYARAWRHVAARFAPDRSVVAFDIFNEPWPGASRYGRCVQPSGCADFDQQLLRPFNRRTFRAIRHPDRRRLLAYEPNVAFNTGPPTYVGDTGDRRALFDFHVYCAVATPRDCPAKEDVPFAHADAQSRRTGDALLVTEFGATEDLARIASVADIADRHRVGWEEWAYWNADPSAPRPVEGLLRRIRRPPTGRNVKRGKLLVLARPYPAAVAGTPLRWRWDANRRRFTFTYSTRRAGGGHFRRGEVTEVRVPSLQFPRGYTVRARGARVMSRPNAQVVSLRARRGARVVMLALAPSGHLS